MKADTQRDYKQRILRVLVHIQRNLDGALTLAELASVARFSAYHFHRIFRGMLGESVKEHIRRLRLERAAHRLKRGDLPVTDIAFEAGYETHEAFTRAFRSMFGESPSGYRELHRALAAKPAPSGVHYAPDGELTEFSPVSEGDGSMEVRFETRKPTRVAFIRHTGPYNEVGPVWGKLMMWAGMHGLFGPQTQMIGVCHDDPDVTPPDKVRYDACVTVPETCQPEGEVGVQEIADGEYAVVTHHGPYEKLGETYRQFCGEWLPQSGRELRHAPGFEIYRNNPQHTPPQELLTDIFMPLEPNTA
jgi:AraC family transcriptional regulator